LRCLQTVQARVIVGRMSVVAMGFLPARSLNLDPTLRILGARDPT
jgi:hypothetical protein